MAAAIKHGYRLIDTAELYHNEESVGLGLKQTGEKREDVFIVSKWWPSAEGAKGAIKSLERCLNRYFNDRYSACISFECPTFSLQSNYVDLYLLHAPQGGHCAEAYRALLEAKKQGKIR